MLTVAYIQRLLTIKNDELKELEEKDNKTPEIEEEIEELKKQISSMTKYIIRYKIAKLLGLENDPYYISHNYMGIEEEDISSLKPEQVTEFNALVAKLPANELKVYKIKRRMATILNKEDDETLIKENYENIEKENPSLIKHNLNEKEIEEFNKLLEEYNNINYNEKSYDYAKLATKELQDAYDKLNITNYEKYNEIKDKYLNVIDKLIGISVKEEDGNTIYNNGNPMFKPCYNIDLTMELKEKYPELNQEITMNVMIDLYYAIRNDNSLSEEKLNDYIKFFGTEMIKMSNNPENEVTLLSFVECLDREITEFYNEVMLNESEYQQEIEARLKKLILFRIELCNMVTTLYDKDLSLQDENLGIYFNFLDTNYNNLSEEERNKVSSYVDDNIQKNINSPKKVGIVNDLFMSMKNTDYERDLQKNYSSNQYAKFQHRNYTSYQKLIMDQIQILQDKKRKISREDYKFENKDIKKEAKLKAIDKEIEELKNILVEYENKNRIKKTNDKYNQKIDKIIDKASEIEDLKELKEQINSKFRKKRIDKKIRKNQLTIKKLKQSEVKIENKQKKIMKPKLWVEQKRNHRDRKFESLSEEYQLRSDDYNTMKEYEHESDKMFSGIKEKIYKYKQNKYQNRSDHFNELLNDLRSGVVVNNGSNRINLNMNAVNNIRMQNAPQMTM